MKIRVGEINILCSDAGRSLAFYRDGLGFEVLEQEGPATHLACGATRFLLLPVARTRPARPAYCAAPEFSIDLMVENIAEAHAHFVRLGAEFASEWRPGDRSFFVRDPDGLVLEVIESAT
ncbi:MAG TPA: VOC family protein [Chthonomonadaceae bacterium]|nr:VOC family protein [Chthonomonadaceae bacterium]